MVPEVVRCSRVAAMAGGDKRRSGNGKWMAAAAGGPALARAGGGAGRQGGRAMGGQGRRAGPGAGPSGVLPIVQLRVEVCSPGGPPPSLVVEGEKVRELLLCHIKITVKGGYGIKRTFSPGCAKWHKTVMITTRRCYRLTAAAIAEGRRR